MPGAKTKLVCGLEVSRVQEIVIVKTHKSHKKNDKDQDKKGQIQNKIRRLLVFDHRPIDEDIDAAIDPCR